MNIIRTSMLKFTYISSVILICFIRLTWNQLIIQPAESTIYRNQFSSLIALCTGEKHTRVLSWVSPSKHNIEENKHSRTTMERKSNGIQLRIRNLTRYDQGEWTCLGVDQLGNSFSKSLQLIVKVPITFISEPIQYAELNSVAIIKCQIREDRNVQIAWFKGREKMDITSSNYQQTIDGLRINRVSFADNDTFWCQADAVETGETNDYQIQLIIAQAITSSKITCVFPCGVEKRTTTLICETNGLPTPKIAWSYGQKNHWIIDGPSKYLMRGNRLIILNVDETDVGRYRCHSSNDFDKSGQISDYMLDVIVPPSISPISPVEVSIDGYRSFPQASFICRMDRGSTEGLSMEWLYANNTLVQTSNDVSIDTSRLATQHTIELKFNSVHRHHHGNYTCQVKNVADMVSTVATLIVLYRPVIVEPIVKEVFVIPNHPASLKCYIDSYPTPVIHWYKVKSPSDLYPVSLQHTSPYVIDVLTKQIGSTLYETQLTFNVFEEDFSYTFECRANNSIMEKHSIHLLRAKLPGLVRISEINPTANTIELNVHPPSDSGGLPLLHYIVKCDHSGVADSLKTILLPVVSNQPQLIVIESLQAATSYRIQIAVETQAGSGIFSVPVQAKTLPGVPVQFSLSNTSCQSFNSCVIKWFVESNGGSEISGIEVTYAKMDRKDQIGKWSEPIRIDPYATEYAFKELKPKTDYLILVRLFNTGGQSTKRIRVRTGHEVKCKTGCVSNPSVAVIIGIIVSILVSTLIIFGGLIFYRGFIAPKKCTKYQRTAASPNE